MGDYGISGLDDGSEEKVKMVVCLSMRICLEMLFGTKMKVLMNSSTHVSEDGASVSEFSFEFTTKC